jgi:hypothetical protein
LYICPFQLELDELDELDEPKLELLELELESKCGGRIISSKSILITSLGDKALLSSNVPPAGLSDSM